MKYEILFTQPNNRTFFKVFKGSKASLKDLIKHYRDCFDVLSYTVTEVKSDECNF